ncbi:MAG: DNRLRE domain-containing protein [Acidobacteriota bacterium]|nr:MAG: DNRLRE domain-containing protein [Acidobacteriota bacterium]
MGPRHKESCVLSALLFIGVFCSIAGLVLAEPVDAGFRDFNYGTEVRESPTGEKVESKLWFTDGYWWGILYNPTWGSYHIYRFDLSSQSWIDTGVPVDEREDSSADALWDDSRQKLYVVSHVFSFSGLPRDDPALWGRLYRYSYDVQSKSYSLDAGFPVNVTRGICETLVLTKDSTGRLWVTWVENQKVMLNHSFGVDSEWAAPFQLPVEDADNLTGDDISSLISFQSNRIGVLWTNQNAQQAFFTYHDDGNAPDVWSDREIAIPGLQGAAADDHINLKSLQVDGSGRVFAVVKTELTEPNAPLILVLVRTRGRGWQVNIFGRVEDDHTRPILLIDEENNKVVVAAAAPEGGGTIYYKISDLNSISFEAGRGIPLISSPSDPRVDEPTSTKQNLSSRTGLLVLASDRISRNYLHGYLPLDPTSAPQVIGFQPLAGEPSTVVTIQGQGFLGAQGVYFGGISADAFTVLSDNQITAVVPGDAQSGKISVVGLSGTGVSDASFQVLSPPVITWFTPAYGSEGTVVSITGSGFTGTAAVTFGGVSSAYSIESDSLILAAVPFGATTGPIGVSGLAGAATSASSFVVSAQVTSIGVTPIADAMTYEGSPSRNYGTDDSLRLRESSGQSRYSFLKFIVGSVPGTIVSARLRLYVTNGSPDGGSLFSVDNSFRGTSVPWTEQEINWGNAPLVGGGALASAGPVAAGNWIELDVSSAVTSPAIYSFGLRSSSGNSTLFSSKEGAAPPELVVEVASGGGSSPSGPFIQSLSPISGAPGTEVTIAGSGLLGTSSVSFNGIATSFVVDSDSSLRAVVPSGASSGPVSVTTDQGTVTSLQSFQVLAATSISSFSPSEGPVGTSVTIYGSGFSGTTSVSFNGSGAAFSVINSVQIQAVVPANASSGPIRVTAGTGTAYSYTDFTVTQPAPSITSIAPTSGPVGTQVFIHGQNLQLVSAVYFGGVSSGFTLVSPGEISTAVPAGATSGPIGLVGPSGTVYSAQSFTVTIPGGGPQTLTFAASADAQVYESYVGSNYGTQGYLRIRDSVGARRVSHLKFQVSGASSGVVSAVLRLYVEDGSSDAGTIFLTSNDWTEGGITWANAPQASGAALDRPGAAETGSWVEYNVTGAVSGDGVYSFVLISSSGDSAMFTSREGAAPPQLVLSVSSDGGPSPSDPTILSFSPGSGEPGTEVVILGTSLFGTTSVSFNGTAALFSVINSGQVNAIVPAGATSGVIRLTTATGTVASGTSFTVTQPAPSITSISPTGGPVGTLVSIHGNNLHLVSAVYFGGASSGFTLISPEEISTAVPAGATTGPIGVVGPAGTVYSAQSFTVTVPGGGPQTLTFAASADAQVYEKYVGSNYSTQEFLRIRDAVGARRVSHLKFQVSGASSGVVSAVLRLYVEDGSSDAGTIFLTSNDWTEGGITWANAPQASGAALDNPGAAATGSWVEYNVSGAVSGDGVYSFVLISSSGDSGMFTSREGAANQPELMIQTN